VTSGGVKTEEARKRRQGSREELFRRCERDFPLMGAGKTLEEKGERSIKKPGQNLLVCGGVGLVVKGHKKRGEKSEPSGRQKREHMAPPSL